MKRFAKAMFRRVGLDVRTLASIPKIESATVKYAKFAGVRTIIDVGAAGGQFGKALREAGYMDRVVSFEPLSLSHAQLTHSAQTDPAWDVAERCAIGDRDDEIVINVSENSCFSSVLSVHTDTIDVVPSAHYVAQETVPLRRLDTVLPSHHVGGVFLLKIDTQGFEWSVMDGAPETLSQAKGVLCEMSLVEVYEGQHLWIDILERMTSLGFVLWHIKTAFSDSRTGRTLQIDGLFHRP